MLRCGDCQLPVPESRAADTLHQDHDATNEKNRRILDRVDDHPRQQQRANAEPCQNRAGKRHIVDEEPKQFAGSGFQPAHSRRSNFCGLGIEEDKSPRQRDGDKRRC